MSVWRETINLIKNGESVDDQTPNRPLQQLAERTQFLKDRLDVSAIGEGLVLFSQVVSSDTMQGDAVYYSISNNEYRPALATAFEDTTGILRTDEKAYVVGIVIRKLNNVTADIIIRGRQNGLVINDASGLALVSGNYYLSGLNSGKLVNQRPAVGVFVATITTQGVIVNPTPREVLEDHIHYVFDLVVDPSGTPVCPNTASNQTAIAFPDNTQEGWLPADDPVFVSTVAPVNAFFGYNWSVNQKLAAIWPPHPLGSAYVELNGVGVSPEHALVDSNGIWWLTNCDTDVPWDANTCISSSAALIERSSSSGETTGKPFVPCSPTTRRLTIWFTKMVSQTSKASVTGIKSAPGSPIVIVGCSTPDASGFCQGKIELDLDIPWARTGNIAGSEVVKTIGGNGQLSVGHVVEGIAVTGLISLTGTKTLTGGQAAGLVTIRGLDPTQITRKLDVALVALNGASESIYQSILPFVGLPSGRITSFIGKVRIPQVNMTTPRLQLDMWFATPTAGTPPANVLIRWVLVNDALLTQESSSSLFGGGFGTLPTAWSPWFALSLNDLGALAAGNYFSRRVINNIAFSSNQLLLFELQRSASDTYAGELAVVNQAATIFDVG